MYKDFRSGKKSIDGVTVSHVSRVCWISSISSPCSPEMNVQVPKWAMFGSLHLTIFLPANTLYISLHSLKLGNQLTQLHGMGIPMDFPWICRCALSSASGSNRSWRNWKPIQRTRCCPMHSPRTIRRAVTHLLSLDISGMEYTWRSHTHTRAYHILYVYTFIWGRNFILLKWKCSDSWWYSSIKKI